MQALILAAGVGRRLDPLTRSVPKCLLEFGTSTLLERSLSILSSLAVKDVIVVTGHLESKVRERTGSRVSGTNIEYVYNPDFRSGGSGQSLLIALGGLREECVVMDSDLLYDRRILEKLIGADHGNCLAVDSNLVDTGEEVKVVGQGGVVYDIGKEVWDRWRCVGEYVGMFRLTPEGVSVLRDELQNLKCDGTVKAEYEEGLRSMVKKHRVYYITTDGLPWIEIDFAEDLEAARTRIFPGLQTVG